MAALELRDELQSFLQSLRADGRIFFPIRHHSPACAWHLRKLIESECPDAVLIEGPAELTPFLSAFVDERTRAPIAVYSTYVDREATKRPDAIDDAPPRSGSYFPLCDYSPELVAIRAAAASGARVRFIDLSYAEQVVAARASGEEPLRSIFDEKHLERSDYVRALTRRAGCRDANELWDHLFESRFLSMTTDAFRDEVAAYCWMARQSATEEELERDGTLAREAAMAGAIRETEGRCIVVTGGFHTAVLPALVGSGPTMKRPKTSAADASTTLIRYSFDQLDALNGYASGMPSPYYYDAFWTALHRDGEEAWTTTAADVIVDIAAMTRREQLAGALSPADEIVALQQAIALAEFRGHSGPAREDLLDAMRGSFVKGGMDAEGVALMALVRQALAGTAVGEIPPGLGVPPIVDDFRRRAAQLRLRTDTAEEKEIALDLYRSKSHRNVSRFLHTLRFIEVPFGMFVRGPDFVSGRALDRVQEAWRYRWSPLTEARLVENSLYGATLAEAAVSLLRKKVADLETAGEGRSATRTVAILIEACRMGLHDEAQALLPLIDRSIAEDPSFVSLTEAITALLLLHESREPLEAHRLGAVNELAVAAHRRACFLIPGLATCGDEEVTAILGALIAHAELAATPPDPGIDAAHFLAQVERLRTAAPVQGALAGAAAGILFGAGAIGEATLIAQAEAFLTVAAAQPAKGAAFIRGLMTGRREASWNVTPLIERIDAALGRWDGAEFLNALPDLRLAFAGFTPRETEKVAGAVAQLHGVDTTVLHESIDARDLIPNGERIESLMTASLQHDGLGHWLVAEETS